MLKWRIVGVMCDYEWNAVGAGFLFVLQCLAAGDLLYSFNGLLDNVLGITPFLEV